MVASKPKRVLNVKVLPGEPTDGTGKVCIHLFIKDEKGPFIEPHVLHIDKESKKIVARATRGRLACDPTRTAAPVTMRGVTTLTLRTDDPRAATCPKCSASKEYKEMMDTITRLEATAGATAV